MLLFRESNILDIVHYIIVKHIFIELIDKIVIKRTLQHFGVKLTESNDISIYKLFISFQNYKLECNVRLSVSFSRRNRCTDSNKICRGDNLIIEEGHGPQSRRQN